jgi:hypothetical protein
LIDLLVAKYGLRSIAGAQRRLSQLGRTLRNGMTAPRTPTRMQALRDFFAISRLRRQVAMSNPLLDFDALLFVGRGNYYGDDPTGQHQLSGPIAFCNRVGGGLYVVKNFKTNAEVIDVLEHSVAEGGN